MFQKKLKCILCCVIVVGCCLITGCSNGAATTSGGNQGTSADPSQNIATDGSALTEDSLAISNSNTSAEGQNPSSTGSTVDTSRLTASYTISTDTTVLNDSYAISDILYGLFLEDINHAVDGGLYAELIKNRSFEYGSAAAYGNKHGWTSTDTTGDFLTFEVIEGTEDNSFLHEQNPSYARLTNTSSEADNYLGIFNKGYLEGMSLTPGEEYTFSIYVRSSDFDHTKPVRITLSDEKEQVYAQDYIYLQGDDWNKYFLSLTPSTDFGTESRKMRLTIELLQGSLDLDMVSLMPVDTYKGTTIRKDIGETLEALNPSFLRFPGGCVIEGRDEETMYSWKDSIGNGATLTVRNITDPCEEGIGSEVALEGTADTFTETILTGDVAVRPQGRSIWNGSQAHPYYTTYGIGFYEFFELCEILDCMPVPILNAGMTCAIQSSKYVVYDINSDEFKQCVQDALDLVEFCRGGEDTYWGSVRIAMGHEEPFALKYIGIGNEQWQSEYFQHYRKFVEAFNEAAEANPELYEGIELIVANGPVSTDRYGWNYVEDCNDYDDYLTTLVDEHYYESPSFFFTNTHRYDSYDRDSQAAVFLGEFAAQSNTLEAALAEAAYMTGLEKNADIVKMACYAPLFGNKTQSQWTPDLIWYDNDSVYGSVNYYVQQLFANNTGTTNLPTTLDVSDYVSTNALSGKVGLGSWQTSVAYDNLTVTDNATGETLYSCTFDDETVLDTDDYDIHEGDWEIVEGRLVQYNTGAPADANTGDAVYVGDTGWRNYTLTVEGEILEGAEGFLIPVCVENSNNTIFWNIGGWGNTVACLQIVTGGSKSGQVSGTVKNMNLQQGKTYTIKMVVEDNHITGYLNNMKYLDYTYITAESLYETACMDENGDIILKVINTTDTTAYISTVLESFDAGAYENTAEVTVLSGNSLAAVNTFEEPDKMIPISSQIEIDAEFSYEAPMYSLNIIRIRKK